VFFMFAMQAARALGVATGALMSPVLLPLFLARRRRLIHHTGVVHSARFVPPSRVAVGAHADLAARLAGPAMVRFSGSVHTAEDKTDALGISMRLHCRTSPSSPYCEGDQDLFFITAPSLAWRKLRSGVARTQRHDFLANTYWAASAYEVEGLGRVSLRLIPTGGGAEGADRVERLQRAIQRDEARLRLEVAPLGSQAYVPVAEIHLGRGLSHEMDTALRLVPASSGRGLRPSGFLQGMRVVPYATGQFTRRLWKH
jgi:hypothetical protein